MLLHHKWDMRFKRLYKGNCRFVRYLDASHHLTDFQQRRQ